MKLFLISKNNTMEEEQNDKNEELLNELLKAENRKIPEDFFKKDNLGKVKPKKKTWVNTLVICLVGILIIAIIVAIVVLVKFDKTIDRTENVSNISDKIVVNINSLEGINENGQIKYDLFFTNTENSKMKDIVLSVRFPSEFSYINSTIEPSFINEEYIKWNLGELDIDDTKVLSLEGILLGTVGSESVLSATMDYGFEGISSSFHSVNSYSVGINKTIFDVEIERNDIFYKDQEFTYKIKIKNNTLKALRNIKLSFEYPESFVVKSFSEEPYEKYGNEKADWIFDLNKKREEYNDGLLVVHDPKVGESDEYYDKEIIITGVVEKDNVNNIDFNIVSGVIVDMNNIENINTVFEKNDVIKTSTSGLNFTINANGTLIEKDTNLLLTSNPNDEFEISFKYNKLDEEASFKDLRLELEFLGDDIIDSDFNLNSTKPEKSEIINNGSSNIILKWNKNNYSDFKNIKGEEKEIKVSFKFKKDLLKEYKDGGYFTNVRVNLYGKNNSKEEITIIGDRKFKIALDTDLKITTAVPGVNLSVNKETGTTEISFRINNTYNKLSGFGVYFTLPEYVDYTFDNFLSRSIRDEYDSENRKIIWIIGDVNPGDEVTGKFYVNITPKEEDIGKNIDFIKDINIVFKDTTINKDFSFGVSPVVSPKKVTK